jgi:hypothetical protein
MKGFRSTKLVRLGIQAAKLPGNDHDWDIAFRAGFVKQAVERTYQEEKFISKD